MNINIYKRTLFIALCSLLVINCDLFQPKNPDYYNDLLDEVAFANAPKLTVTVAF